MSQDSVALEGRWALVLGASSGFGASTSLEMASVGMNIFGVHLDTRATLPLAEQVKRDIQALGQEAVFFNTNAASAEKRQQVLDEMQEILQQRGQGLGVYVLLHSLAFGTLRPYIAAASEEAITQAQMDMTLDVMAHSLVYWTQDLFRRGMLPRGSRVFAMTSAGSHRVIRYYGAVSAAKAALEAHVRQLAFEMAPHGVSVNAVRAGITDTPALRKIPGHEELLEYARRTNPHGRTTTPKDVAQVIATLCSPKAAWISGSVIAADGAEDVV